MDESGPLISGTFANPSSALNDCPRADSVNSSTPQHVITRAIFIDKPPGAVFGRLCGPLSTDGNSDERSIWPDERYFSDEWSLLADE